MTGAVAEWQAGLRRPDISVVELNSRFRQCCTPAADDDDDDDDDEDDIEDSHASRDEAVVQSSATRWCCCGWQDAVEHNVNYYTITDTLSSDRHTLEGQ